MGFRSLGDGQAALQARWLAASLKGDVWIRTKEVREWTLWVSEEMFWVLGWQSTGEAHLEEHAWAQQAWGSERRHIKRSCLEPTTLHLGWRDVASAAASSDTVLVLSMFHHPGLSVSQSEKPSHEWLLLSRIFLPSCLAHVQCHFSKKAFVKPTLLRLVSLWYTTTGPSSFSSQLFVHLLFAE